MQYTKYIAPPKLKSDFLLGGLTLTELLIGLGLLFLFFSVSVKMAFIVVGIWVVFNVRLYEGRSIRTYLGIIIRYGGIMSVSEEKTWNACRLTGNI